MNLHEAAALINSSQRKNEDPALIHIFNCSICGNDYARLPQDVALAVKKGSPSICNLCLDSQRKSQKKNRLYYRRNSKLNWSNSLGIAFSPPTGDKAMDGPYTETMLRFELWLRDELGYKPGQLGDYETSTKLRKRFFEEFIQKEPELFSAKQIETINHQGQQVYVCTGCQAQITPNSLYQCCASKKKSK